MIDSTPLEHLQGKYEILDKIREGGMGAIYKVRHRLLDEVRVIKLIRPQYKGDEDIKARFAREAKTAIRLHHPNIAQLYDYSIDADGTAFIVMEYIEGRTFGEVLHEHGALPVTLCLELAQQSLAALGYLHRKGIVHRDIAPDNLMLSRGEDGGALVKLIDLGVAKALVEGASSFTVAGTFLGKLRYASPEQFRAAEGLRVDERSDLYSFGVVLYQILTDRLPIRGNSLSTLMAGHIIDPPLGFDETDPDGRVPEDLRETVMRALEKNPERRFPSAEEFTRALAGVQSRFPLAPGEVDALLGASTAGGEAAPARTSGTQDRLDRHFRPGPTAAEILAATAAPATLRVTTRRSPTQDQEEALLLDARVLVGVGPERDAIAKIAEVLKINPENAEARRLQRLIERRHEKRTTSPAETPAVDEAAPTPSAAPPAAEAAPPPAEQALSPSVERLASPAALPPASPVASGTPAPPPVKDTTAARMADLQARVAALLGAARVASDDGRYDVAVDALEGALSLDPDDELVRGVLEETRRRRDQGCRFAGAAGFQEAAKSIRRHLEEGNLVAAEEDLLEVRQVHGDRHELMPFERKLERAKAEARARVEIGRLCDEALELASQGRLPAAFKMLERARDVEGLSDELRGVLDTAEALLRQQIGQYRAHREVAEVLASVSSFLKANQVTEANRAVEVAEKLFPHEPAISALRRVLELGGDPGRAAAVARRLDEAHARAEAGSYTEARSLVEEAAGLDPGSPGIESVLEDLRLREAGSIVDACLGRGDRRGAAKALAAAERQYPASPALRVLRRKIESAG